MLNKYIQQQKTQASMKDAKVKILSRKLKHKRKALANNVDARRMQWLDQIRNNEDFREIYQAGSTKLSHPANICFRTRNKQL